MSETRDDTNRLHRTSSTTSRISSIEVDFGYEVFYK